ncbi:MAG: hypothetical protein ABI469_08560, partial [Gemmatimonadales bacterium]
MMQRADCPSTTAPIHGLPSGDTFSLPLKASVAMLLFGVCAATPTDNPAQLPFSVGEKLGYEVSIDNGRKVG